MFNYTFDKVFIEKIHKINKKILEYILNLSEEVIDTKKDKYFDIVGISISELRKLPDKIILINDENKIKFYNNDILYVLYSYYTIRKNSVDNIEKLINLLYHFTHENRTIEYEIKEVIKANVIVLYQNYLGKDICKDFLNKYSEKEKNELRLIYFPFIAALPYLQLDLQSFIDFVYFTQIQYKNDLMSVDINDSIQKYSKIQSENAKMLLDVIKKRNEIEILTLIPEILYGLAETLGLKSIYEQTLYLYGSNIINLKRMAIFSLGFFNYDKEEYEYFLKNTIKLYDKIFNSDGNEFLTEIIQASHYLVKYSDKPIVWVEKASIIKDDNLKFYVANFLNKNTVKYKHEQWFKNVFLNLSEINIVNKGTIERLGFILLSVVNDLPDLVVSFLFKWIDNHETEEGEEKLVNFFLSAILELYKSNKELLEKFVTNCFNQDNDRFHIAISNIVHELGTYGYKDINLSKTYLDKMTEEDIEFILTKIVGYVIAYEQLCLLVFSAIKSIKVNESLLFYIQEIFADYIGYNYPDYVINFLENPISTYTEKEKLIASRILSQIKKIENDLKSLKHLKEFETPRNRRLTYFSLKSLQQTKMMEDAQKGSIMLSMINKTILKGGRSSFTKFDDHYTDKMILQEHKMSMYLPQGEIKDPIGQAILRYHCKIKRKN